MNESGRAKHHISRAQNLRFITFDLMIANLVVADESRSTGTICLAVSLTLKSQGVPGRPRLFEVIQNLN